MLPRVLTLIVTVFE